MGAPETGAKIIMDRAVRALILSACLAVAALQAGPATAQPAPAQATPGSVIGSGTLSALSHAAVPQPSYVEVVLTDDSPDNVRLAWDVHEALGRYGWLADQGPTLRLTLETYTIGALGDSSRDAGTADRRGGGAEGGESLYVLGVLEGHLVDAASGARLWEARAVYRMSDGDLPLGALAMAPLFVAALGRNIDNEPVSLQAP